MTDALWGLTAAFILAGLALAAKAGELREAVVDLVTRTARGLAWGFVGATVLVPDCVVREPSTTTMWGYFAVVFAPMLMRLVLGPVRA